ncbi:MAG: ABC transporter ATP-binding protein [Ilumatobacteraceae bacterium]
MGLISTAASREANARPVLTPAPKDAGGWLRRLGPFLRIHRRRIALAVGASIVGQVVVALTPVIEKTIVDGTLVSSKRPLAPLLALLVAAGLVSFCLSFVRRAIGGRVALDVSYDLRTAVFDRLQRLDFGTHDRMDTGQVVSRASSDVGMMLAILSIVPILLGNVVLLVVSLIVMTILSPPLTLIALVIVPALLVVGLKMRRAVFPATWDAQQRAGEVAGVVDEAVTGVRVVKGFGQERRELQHLADTAGDLYRSRARLVRIQSLFTPTLSSIPVVGQVAVLAAGGWLAIEGHLTLGTFLAFSSYLLQMVSPVRMVATTLAVAQQARAGGERLLDILDTPSHIVDHDGAVDLGPLQHEIRFEHVHARYGTGADGDADVLDDFDLTVRAGETVALVGASGAGKSSAVMLLPRFYDVTGGRVTFDGVDVRDATLHSLRGRVAVAFEEVFLFSESIRANIAYGRPEATDDEIVAAARLVQADGFIRQLPDGYDTIVGERGLTLSGGQRQRIALARALLTEPSVLILDDATSSIDAETEERIHDALHTVVDSSAPTNGYAGGRRTTILIAHRQSTLRLADRIVVVERGRVVDDGTYDELVANSPTFRELFLTVDLRSTSPAGSLTVAPPGAPDTSLLGTQATRSLRSLSGATDSADLEPAGQVGRRPTDNTATESADLDPAYWPHERVNGRRLAATFRVPTTAGADPGGGQGRATGAGGNMSGALSATPELLAALDRLPPADDDARLDVRAEMDAPAGRFSLREFSQPFRGALGIGLLLVLVDTGLTLLGPFFVKRGIDRGVTKGSEAALLLASLGFLAAAIGDWFATRGYTWVTGRTAERMLYALRIRIFAQLQRLSLDYYDSELAGRVMTRMTTDVEALSQLVQTGLITAFVSVLTCLGVLVWLLVLSPPLALAAAAVLPPLVVATWWYRRRAVVTYELARDRISELNADFQESLSGVRIGQALRQEDRNIAAFREINGRYLDARYASQKLIALYFPFVLLLADLGSALVLGAGRELVLSGTVTTGVVIAFVLYLDQFFSPIQQLSQVFDTWQQAAVSIERISELMATPSGTPEAAHPVEPPALDGAVTFDSVDFAYANTGGLPVLAGLDLRIAPGESIALVGETGAGKSTVMKLIARFYDVTGGAVRVDGLDVRGLALGDFRHQLGVVPQEAFLFTGTLRDNIAYGRPDASDAEVESAARAVGAHEMIVRHADGYLTAVTERGRSLSSGERQLIALARARLVDPAILLLDEATSNLDLATEARVQRAMTEVSRNRTTVLIAHRLPTARTADRIALVADGAVAEQGTHEELLALGGRYAALWRSFTAVAPVD